MLRAFFGDTLILLRLLGSIHSARRKWIAKISAFAAGPAATALLYYFLQLFYIEGHLCFKERVSLLPLLDLTAIEQLLVLLLIPVPNWPAVGSWAMLRGHSNRSFPYELYLFSFVARPCGIEELLSDAFCGIEELYGRLVVGGRES